MKKLYVSSDIGLLNLLKSQLETENIVALIKNEFPPAAGEVPSVVASPELWVINDEDYTTAGNILNEFLNASTQPKENWTCTHCGELLEGQFELCWKCGNVR